MDSLNQMKNAYTRMMEAERDIIKIRQELRKAEKEFEMAGTYFNEAAECFYSNINKDDNTITLSANTFSKIINAISWLENNNIVNKGFLNSIMEDVKDNQKGML